MKHLSLPTVLALIIFISLSQTSPAQNHYLKLSGGRVNFGTGDILGPSFALDVSKNIIKKPSFALNKLLLGGELIFENGVRNPVIAEPTLDEFYGETFYHVSNTVVWPKVSWYPFGKILTGFNIQAGPTMGYSYRSTELHAALMVDALGQAGRQSALSLDNGFVYGYRISTGFEFNLSQRLLTGFRLDFSNNNEGEINTLAGVKIGARL